MGNAASQPSYHKLDRIFPHNYGQTSMFVDYADRQQFIHAVITVMTQNGSINLQQYDFRLLYSRRENDRVVARIVAELDGVIKAKIEPDQDGKDQTEAFKALRKGVEVELERILTSVPVALAGIEASEVTAGPSRLPSRSGVGVLPADAPPAYGSADVKGSAKR